MSNRDANYIISGSGVSGLISALILCEKSLGHKTVIIEKSATLGGLLKKYNYGNFGDFDYGMHNFLETGIKDLDALIFNLLPETEWQLLEGEKRDLAGIYFNNKLQKNTPYFDLRNLEKNEFNEAITSLLIHINESIGKASIDKNCNAEDYAIKRFGEYVAKKTIIPSVEKIHRMKASELDYMATVFTPMSRVAIADAPLIEELTQSSVLRDFFAWSDQRTLPLSRSSGRRAYYPIKYGAYRVVDAILEKIKKAGVQILTDSEITEVNTEENNIKSIGIKTNNDKIEFTNPKELIWTANIPLLGKLLKTDFTGLKNDKALKTIIINILIDKPLNMGDLYYFFCYQSGFYTYRLTNYVTYSAGAIRNGLYPICMEFLMTDEELNSGINIEERAEVELQKFGILKENTKVVFKKAEILESGFPMPSWNNIVSLKKIRNDIRSRKLENLKMIGILAEDNLFFQTDVLIDLHNKLNNI